MSNPSPTQPAGLKTETAPSLYLVCGLLLVVILGLDLMTPSGLAMGVPYIAAVVFSLRSPKRRFIVVTAISCSAYTIIAVLHKPGPGDWWVVLVDRTLALFAIWVTALLALQRRNSDEQRERATQEREKALADVRVLRGLLPICASCKQIRDDDGYWRQIEVYIRDHSEAKFSHGICPACARRLYPEYYEANQPESGPAS